ncbi:unnamed protein product [Heterobilharzia americana]|nr:unnamed protein product [Heterobilharzia americana]
MNKRPINTLNPLLCISVRIEHYVELRITDKYAMPLFQYRFEQHLSSPWKEPRKPIKTKLILTYTSVILKDTSWWPYRVVHSIDYKSIRKFITFNQESLRFAIGIYDEDFAEKQYVVMSTKTFSDIEKLIQLIHSQLLICRYSLKQESEQSNKSVISKSTTQKNLTNLSKSLDKIHLIDKSHGIITSNSVHPVKSSVNGDERQFNEKLGNNTYKTLKYDNNRHQGSYHDPQQEDHHPYYGYRHEDKHTRHIYTNLDNIFIDKKCFQLTQAHPIIVTIAIKKIKGN